MDDICRVIYGPIATQALGLLARYEQAVDALLANGRDPALYSEASALFDTLQLHASDLAGVRASWVEVLISRFEFTQALWQTQATGAEAGRLRSVGLTHLAAIASFRQESRIRYLPCSN